MTEVVPHCIEALPMNNEAGLYFLRCLIVNVRRSLQLLY
jgi:hypothetical protein